MKVVLALIGIAVLLTVLFQVLKRFIPALEHAAGIVKQLVFLLLATAIMPGLTALGIPVPDELRSAWSQALLGTLLGLASLGVHGIKVQLSPDGGAQ